MTALTSISHAQLTSRHLASNGGAPVPLARMDYCRGGGMGEMVLDLLTVTNDLS